MFSHRCVALVTSLMTLSSNEKSTEVSNKFCGIRIMKLANLAWWSSGPGFKTTCCHFKTWAISFTPLGPCLSEETVKAVGPFYLVSTPGEVKDPTQGVNV